MKINWIEPDRELLNNELEKYYNKLVSQQHSEELIRCIKLAINELNPYLAWFDNLSFWIDESGDMNVSHKHITILSVQTRQDENDESIWYSIFTVSPYLRETVDDPYHEKSFEDAYVHAEDAVVDVIERLVNLAQES